MVPQWTKRAQRASVNLPLKSHVILFGSGRQTGSNKTRLHKAQQQLQKHHPKASGIRRIEQGRSNQSLQCAYVYFLQYHFVLKYVDKIIYDDFI